MRISPSPPEKVIYPDTDGQPMADNTLQFQWITTLKANLDWCFREDPNVFVAGDLLWYPVEGEPKIRLAPDVLVAMGRPKGYRGSYRQWEEGSVPPHVVMEVLSPGNRYGEMIRKFKFYEQYGVEEYYVIDPEREDLTVHLRQGHLRPVATDGRWESPLLKISVDTRQGLRFFRPDGTPFLTYEALGEEAERERAAKEALGEEVARERAAKEAARAEVEALREKLRRAGLA